MVEFFQNLKNIIDFSLREKFSFSRKNYVENNESKYGLFSKETEIRENALLEKYGFSYLKWNSTRLNYLENLYLMDVLDKYFKIELKEELKVLDVGCKNWSYAKGEYFFFKAFCETLVFDGIEIDANRLYNNFYSRREVAKFYMKGLENTRYLAKNFLNHEEKYDLIVWILPFVFNEPHLRWGLPKQLFSPENMLEHAYNCLEEGGKIFIINQGAEEFEEQKKLCEILQIEYLDVGKIESDFWEYGHERFALIIEKH